MKNFSAKLRWEIFERNNKIVKVFNGTKVVKLLNDPNPSSNNNDSILQSVWASYRWWITT